MAFDIQTTLETIRDYIRNNARADDASIGPRLRATGEDTYASVYMDSVQIAETTLTKTIELHTVVIRLYQHGRVENLDTVELNLASKAELIMSDLLGDFDLGGTIRAVDVGGIYGQTPRVDFDWIEETSYRVADLTIPLIVDDSLTFTA